MSYVFRWSEASSTLDAFERDLCDSSSSQRRDERDLCGPHLLSAFDPDGDTVRRGRNNLTDDQLETEDGSGAVSIVQAV